MAWEFSEYELDEKLLELRLRGTQVHLSPLPLRVLIHLVQNSSRAVPAKELRSVLWPGVIVADTSLRQAVRSLRQALGAEGAKRIASVRGYGYRFEGPVRRSQPAALSVPTEEVARTANAAGSKWVDLHRPFVGRHSEIRRLLDAAETAHHGKAQVMIVTGRPGLGKTRLAEELSALVKSNFRVVWGRCWEGGGSPPFWPWDEVRRGMLGEEGHVAPEQDEPMLDGGRRGDSGAFHLSSQDPPPRFRLFEAFTELVRQKSEATPLVIVLDDLHAADEPALLLLSFLARELSESKTLILGTFREEEMRRRARCGEIIDRLASSGSTIALHGLDTDSIRALVEEGTRRTAHPAVVSRLLEITEGNPLFLHELIRLYGDAIGESVPELIDVARSPSPIRDAIRRQLRPLSPSAREMMSASAIVGTETDLDVLSQVLSWSADDIATVADEVTTAGLMKTVGPARLRFSHELLREQLYEELDAVQRRSLHRRTADVLARSGRAAQPGSAAAIAHHLLECLPDAQAAERAVAALAQAAAAASSGMAHEEARRYHRTRRWVCSNK
jgi:predicted ATPase/DNA-binding winged helix-turn-helix (wHTH) protein